MLEMVGTKWGLPASLVWNGGELIGTDWAIRLFADHIARAEGAAVGYPQCTPRYHDHLQHADSVYWLALSWFDEGVEITGDLPHVPMSDDRIY